MHVGGPPYLEMLWVVLALPLQQIVEEFMTSFSKLLAVKKKYIYIQTYFICTLM